MRLRCMLDALADRGCELDVLTFPEGVSPSSPSMRIERVPSIPGLGAVRPGFSFRKVLYDWLLLWRAVSFVRRQRPDIVHAVEEAAFLAIALKWLFGVPFVYDMHSSIAEQMVERFPTLRLGQRVLDALERKAMRESAGVIAVSPYVKTRVARFSARTPVVAVEDAIQFDGKPLAGTREDLRATIGASGPMALYIGNLEHYQGIDLLLDAFSHTRAHSKSAHLVIIGGLPRDIAEYRQKAQGLGLEESVHFLGPRPVDQLSSYLDQADVLVSPRTKGHNTPMKIYSYVASGRPVLATRLSTHTQALNDDIAYLAAPEPEAFGSALGELLNDSEKRARLGRRGREYAMREFSVEAFRHKLLSLYEQAGVSF